MNTSITIEPSGSRDTGTCDCCGRSCPCIWGYAHGEDGALAVYYVHWTLGHVPEKGANIDLVIGRWGEATTAQHRRAIALAYRLLETGPSMMIIDATTRPIAHSTLVGSALRRDEVIGTAAAQEAFAIADAVLTHDARVTELLGGWTMRG